jgi:hypothetical protein
MPPEVLRPPKSSAASFPSEVFCRSVILNGWSSEWSIRPPRIATGVDARVHGTVLACSGPRWRVPGRRAYGLADHQFRDSQTCNGIAPKPCRFRPCHAELLRPRREFGCLLNRLSWATVVPSAVSRYSVTCHSANPRALPKRRNANVVFYADKERDAIAPVLFQRRCGTQWPRWRWNNLMRFRTRSRPSPSEIGTAAIGPSSPRAVCNSRRRNKYPAGLF